MRDRVSKPDVAIMRSVHELIVTFELISCNAYLRVILPHEIAANFGLIFPVDAQRVMRAGPAKVISPDSVGMISIGAGIDQHGLSRESDR